ncbi:DUF2637 domain-containing protein [Streptomyces sp. NPDC000878]
MSTTRLAKDTARAFHRVHRVLIGVVVAGAVVIAAIGFAGSYAAVRELALKKGFGNFSYVFPIGIDAGICVLLALDLLLTWIRIPFPLLRQTAWLLTMATIAFNGAAAWPDPLGVGMHAVIPVLFVVAVEAARHAIGRMADITADKHMEGVRLTRWLLSPLPTFLLWRRMKLWELRSYDQVMKLEQERLVYQARLHARFGRAWRRKAPVESLMPLRLARYGVPLAETAPSGLAAAGLTSGLNKPPPPHTGALSASPQPQSPATAAGSGSMRRQPDRPSRRVRKMRAAPPGTARPPRPSPPVEPDGRFDAAYQMWLSLFHVEPTASQFAFFLRNEYNIPTAGGTPLPDVQLLPLLRDLQQRHTASSEGDRPREDSSTASADETTRHEYGPDPILTRTGQHSQHPSTAALAGMNEQNANAHVETRPLTKENPTDTVPASPKPGTGETKSPAEETAPSAEDVNDTAGKQAPSDAERALTTVDRYYHAWTQYLEQYGDEPTSGQLSVFLAGRGINGPGGKPVSPSTLRRYYVSFRVYRTWAEHRTRNPVPSPDTVAQDCSTHGITAQYNKPIAPDTITKQAADFERRWHALTRHHTGSHH